MAKKTEEKDEAAEKENTKVTKSAKSTTTKTAEKTETKDAQYPQHQQLRFGEAQQRRGHQGISCQVEHQKQKYTKGNFSCFIFHEAVLFHPFFSFISFLMAASKCSGPLGTAMPPN